MTHCKCGFENIESSKFCSECGTKLETVENEIENIELTAGKADDKDIVYTIKDLSKTLKIGINSAYTLVNSKNFPKIVVGRKILVSKKALESWLDVKSKSAV